MYSLVVLMALGTAGEAPDWGCGWGGRGYCGSYSYTACYSYSRCYTPCYSYSACYTPCYTYCRPVTTCYAPVMTCYTPVITCGPAMVVPVKPMPATPKKDEKKKPEEVSTQATIIVSLPADAQLTFDGERTKSTSTRRTFVTPELNPGTEYSYVLKAEAMRDGKPVVLGEKRVTIHAGDTTEVSLGLDSTNVASR